jgi:hypothetical protein
MMSSSHIAGSAAVLLGLHPTWSPAQVKSALVNTADRVVKNALNAIQGVGPTQQGGGRENLSNSADATVSFDPRVGELRTDHRLAQQADDHHAHSDHTSASAATFSLQAYTYTPAAGTLGSV